MFLQPVMKAMSCGQTCSPGIMGPTVSSYITARMCIVKSCQFLNVSLRVEKKQYPKHPVVYIVTLDGILFCQRRSRVGLLCIAPLMRRQLSARAIARSENLRYMAYQTKGIH